MNKFVRVFLLNIGIITFLSIVSPALADSLDNWHWRNPLIQGNSLCGITYGNNTFVAVGGSSILTSPDGITWTQQSSGITNYLNRITYGNGIFVAVGSCILTSPDLITWTQRSSGTTTVLQGITYGNGIFVGVGSSGTILTSPDGITWTQQSSGTTTSLYCITYGNGIFVAVGSYGIVLTSPDGITWTQQSSGTTTVLQGVTYGNGIFVSVGWFAVITSPDGMTWTQQFPENDEILYDIAYGNNTFVAVANSGTILTSPDGITWTQRSSGTTTVLQGVTYGNGIFVAVGGSTVLTSSYGTTWTLRSLGVTAVLEGVTYGNGIFVGVGSSGTILTSPDGITWTQQSSGITNYLNKITYGNGIFVAVGSCILTSPDGITWTQRAFVGLTGITYGNGIFVAVGGRNIFTSPDGITWTTRSLDTTGGLTGITYGNGIFVAVGSGDSILPATIFTSPDGITWAQSSSITSIFSYPVSLESVSYGNNMFVAVGRGGSWGNGIVFTSPDGITWTQRSYMTPEFCTLEDITYGEDTFVAVGEGLIISSPNGINWSQRNSGNYSLYSITFGESTFVAVGSNGTILQSDPISSDTEHPCAIWNDVIEKYNNYVNSQVSWSDVIACYQAYVQLSVTPENLDAVKAYLPSFDEAAEQMLLKNGFVVLGNDEENKLSDVYSGLFFQTGISTFITTDALLHIFHITYDDFLETAEKESLSPKMETLCSLMNTCVRGAYEEITEQTFLKEAARRLWVVFAVSEALINGDTEVSGEGIEPIQQEANDYLTKIYNHNTTEYYPGDDYTQYEPRGHYAGDETLERYFRTVTWLGRRIFRVYDPNDIETSEYELASAAIMAYVLARSDCGALSLWQGIYNFTSTLVNQADSITPIMVDGAMGKVFGSSYDSSGYLLLENHDNLLALKNELLTGDYPESEIIPVPLQYPDALPKRYVQFMGVRYVMDGEAMQETCFPYVENRWLPKGLDVAATVFSSTAAYEELAGEMALYPGLQEQVDMLKVQFDGISDTEWQKSTYNYWLSTLRSLSEKYQGSYPSFMRYPLWEREKLNTTMASWAELRHDNILYAKETYIPSPMSEGYGIVEPYPTFYKRLQGICEQIINAMDEAGVDLPCHKDRFELMANWAEEFGKYAVKIANGEQLISSEQTYIKGWGLDLLYYFGPYGEGECVEEDDDPELIADVATSSTGQVLHEAVGKLNPIVIMYEQPEDKKVLAGIGYVMSYYEVVEADYNRLNDEEWKQMLINNPPLRPSWTDDYIYPSELAE